MAKDVGDMVQNDVQKVKKYRGKGIRDLSPTKMLEVAFWGGAIFALAFMLVSMPFTGPGKAISGEVWLLGSIGGIVGFGGLALFMRQLPEI